jgi:hypothetical protein
MQEWLMTQLKTIYSDGIRKHAGCYTNCIEKQGDYAENKMQANQLL